MLDRTLNAGLQRIIGHECVLLEPINQETVYAVPVEHWLAVVSFLTQEMGLTHLSAITIQQREDAGGKVEVMYHFWNGQGLTFRLTLPAERPEIPSITEAIPGADFYEREAAEIYGIHFTGREATPHLLLPEDWDGPPPSAREVEND